MGGQLLGEMAVMEICLVLHLPSNAALLPRCVRAGHGHGALHHTLHHSAYPEIPVHYLEIKTVLYGQSDWRYQRNDLKTIHTQGRG